MTNGQPTLHPNCAQIVPPAIRSCAFFGVVGAGGLGTDVMGIGVSG